MVVTASRTQTKRKEQPIAISKLEVGDIERVRPQLLAEVVNKVAGVQMVDLGSEQHSMSIRQPMSYKAYFLYLEDGLPIRPMGIFNHNALIEMNMFGTSGIEIIKGPSSSLYGPEAVGGTLNFLSRKPSFKNDLKLGVQHTSEGNFIKRAHANLVLNKNIGWNISGYHTQQKNGFAEHTDYEKFSINSRLDFFLTDKTQLTQFTTYHFLDADMGGGSVKKDAFFAKEFGSLHRFAYRKVKSFRSNIRLNHEVSDELSVKGVIFYRNNKMDQNPSYRIKDLYNPWKKKGDKSKAIGEENSNQFQSYGGLLQYQYQTNDLKWITGVFRDYSPQDYHAEDIDVVQDTLTRRYLSYSNTNRVHTDYSARILNTAVYTQFEHPLNNAFSTVLGARYDRISFSHVDHLGIKENGETNYSNISLKGGLTYNPSNIWGLYSNYSQGFYAPGVSELFRARANNQNLKPAYFNNYEIGGWFQVSDKFRGEYSFYRLDGVDEVITYRSPEGNYENRNAGKTRHQGIELSVSYIPSSEFKIQLNGSYASHKFREFLVEEARTEKDKQGNMIQIDAVDFTGNEQSLAPKILSNLDIYYTPAHLKKLTVGLNWHYKSSYWMDDANSVKYQPKTFLGLKGNSLIDMTLSYVLDQAEVFAKVQNLSDEYFSNSASKSAWGETYRLGKPRTFIFGLTLTL